MDDPTATVNARIVDAAGNSHSKTGIVERNGLVWVEGLPLAAGANTLTVTSTDAAGNTSVTNIGVIKSAITITIDSVPDEQLNNPTTTVTGTISVNDRTLWVNGVKITSFTANGQGGWNWEADEVSTGSGGTAVIQATAIPNDDNNGDGSGGNGYSASGTPNNPSSPNASAAAAVPERGYTYYVEKYTLDYKYKLEWHDLHCPDCDTDGINKFWNKLDPWTSELSLPPNVNSSGNYISGYSYDHVYPDGTRHLQCSEAKLVCPRDRYEPSKLGTTTITDCNNPTTHGKGGLWKFLLEVWEHHTKQTYLDPDGSTWFQCDARWLSR